MDRDPVAIAKMAILLHELMGEKARSVKIFATDVDRASLEIANTGAFGAEELASLSEERLDRYFIRQGEIYTVVPEIRRMIVFAPHNILENAPFTRLDLVSCRNLLIYFTTAAQKKVLSLFHFALRMNGAMVLGPSESPGDLAEEFDVIDRKWKIYRKRRNVRLAPEGRMPLTARRLPTRGRMPVLSQLRSSGESHWLRIYDRLLDRHIPPSLLIDDKQVLLHSFGGAETYLKVQSGRASNNILRMVHDGLKTPVSGAIQQALRDGRLVSFTGVQVNLIGNAARYSPAGSEITWSVRRDGTHAEIRVRDQGHGIPRERLEEIFEPFVQVEDQRGFSRGLGLGLALVKSLVNAHGGTVEACSEGPGHGSEFVVRLPLRITPEEMSNPISLPLANRPARTIVLVEDDHDVGSTLRHFLQEQGFEVTLVASGREGLETIRRLCPDVAIMDIGLPDMSGDLVARALKESECGSKAQPALVALTGYGQEQDRVRIKAAGFDLHLVKPVDLDLLLKILRGEEADQPVSTRSQSPSSETRLLG